MGFSILKFKEDWLCSSGSNFCSCTEPLINYYYLPLSKVDSSNASPWWFSVPKAWKIRKEGWCTFFRSNPKIILCKLIGYLVAFYGLQGLKFMTRLCPLGLVFQGQIRIFVWQWHDTHRMRLFFFFYWNQNIHWKLGQQAPSFGIFRDYMHYILRATNFWTSQNF